MQFRKAADTSDFKKSDYHPYITPKGDHYYRESFTHKQVGRHPLSLYKFVDLKPDDVSKFSKQTYEDPMYVYNFDDDLTCKTTVAEATRILDSRAASTASYFYVRDIPIPSNLAKIKLFENCGSSDMLIKALLESAGELICYI